MLTWLFKDKIQFYFDHLYVSLGQKLQSYFELVRTNFYNSSLSSESEG